MENRKIRKNVKKRHDSVIQRIPRSEFEFLKSCGGGNWRMGLSQLIGWYKRLNQDPTAILEKDIDILLDDASKYLPDNHMKHFVDCGYPALLRYWARSGKIDLRLLKTPNKALDDFDKKKKQGAVDATEN